MSESGISRIANLVYDKSNKRWVREPSPEDHTQVVFISGITPVGGKLPVDTEISISGNVILENMRVESMPLTEVYPSGTYAQIIQADDLVSVVQYNESDVFASHTTISGVTYTSSTLGTTVTETFASGTNYITITRNST